MWKEYQVNALFEQDKILTKRVKSIMSLRENVNVVSSTQIN